MKTTIQLTMMDGQKLVVDYEDPALCAIQWKQFILGGAQVVQVTDRDGKTWGIRPSGIRHLDIA